ncbi:MAG TPA: FAD-binding oxidoreductase, partial [Pirellulaceae bacterium]
RSTRDDDIARLASFAVELLPSLSTAEIEARWSGLRPATGDGYPYLGRIQDHPHLFVAAGHFRSGIQLAPVTARAIRELILGQPPSVDLFPFRPNRE